MKPSGDLKLSRDTERLLTLADREAQEQQSANIEIHHVVKAIFDVDAPLPNAIRKTGADPSPLQELANDKNENKDEFLKLYTINLTQQAKDGKLDPVIGRYDEIRRVMQILSRRTKNNPVLIREPGVGKTAIAEGLGTVKK